MTQDVIDARVFATRDVTTLLDLAVNEDLRDLGDVTSLAVPADAACSGRVVFRQAGVVCGLPLAERVLTRIAGPEAEWIVHSQDGAKVGAGTAVATIKGPARGILAAERTLLNFMQRLSGVASATAQFVEAAGSNRARILDTRKTTPGWRLLEKYAVRTGGGENHRIGLYDQVLLKDNHLALLGGEGGVAGAIARAREAAPPGTPLEIEVTTRQGALAAARAGADIVLLDNFSAPDLAKVVQAVRDDASKRGESPPLLEASGGIDLTTVRGFAETGVDRISVGWITHSCPALDIALDFELGAPV